MVGKDGFNDFAFFIAPFIFFILTALSMGLGDFLSSKAEIEYARQERKREAW